VATGELVPVGAVLGVVVGGCSRGCSLGVLVEIGNSGGGGGNGPGVWMGLPGCPSPRIGLPTSGGMESPSKDRRELGLTGGS
jgi:hypothetical protein